MEEKLKQITHILYDFGECQLIGDSDRDCNINSDYDCNKCMIRRIKNVLGEEEQ